MRLTLRTLLAYLDDTLEAGEIKEIGLKVSESDAAQELIARIKQVTRRRRLTSPPATGPGAKFDPNTIAEYLDNLLSSDQVAEVEKVCLESDVHLAEIAACHQILTLVLGQPATVPPTAKQRMYGLVHGKEAIASRRPKALAHSDGVGSDGDAHSDADEALLLGLPLYQRQSQWLRWALPLAAACLVCALAFAIYNAIRPPVPPDKLAFVAETHKDATNSKKPDDDHPSNKDNSDKVNATKDNAIKDNAKKDKTDTQPDKTGNPDKTQTKPDNPTQRPDPGKIPPPSDARREVGRYVFQESATPSFLLHSSVGKGQWQRLKSDDPIFTNEMLLCLPGFHGAVRVHNDVDVRIMGSLYEFLDLPPGAPVFEPVLESAVVLHDSKSVNLDLTLDRGRVYLSNNKPTGPITVRLRFLKEVWDLILEEQGTEIGVELVSAHTPYSAWGSNAAPRSELHWCLLKGHARAVIGHEEYDLKMPGPAVIFWDNEGKGIVGPGPLKEASPAWSKNPASNKQAAAMLRAVKEMGLQLADDKKPLSVAILEVLRSDEPRLRKLAVLCLGAIDDMPNLLDALDDQDASHIEVRLGAILALRHCIGRNKDQDAKLFDPAKNTGVLIDKKYKLEEADQFMLLIHDLTPDQIEKPEMYQLLIGLLRHNKLPIRELAYSQLWGLVPRGLAIPYNPAEGTNQREFAVQEWKKLIPDGKLPPKAAPPPKK